jgi:peptidoglycan/xylan/chitin deacetylase (PgdA/CDA1 family)
MRGRMTLKTNLLRVGLETLHFTGVASALAPRTRGIGAIFMLHHVLPDQPAEFSPNRLLQVTPAFLDAVLAEVRRAGFDIVSLDEAQARMTGAVASKRPFACFTLDDGYRDNRDHALPLFERHKAPFAIYVASDFADGRGCLWWLLLERAIARSKVVSLAMDGEPEVLRCSTVAQKNAAFDRIYRWARRVPEQQARRAIVGLAEWAGVDELEPCRELVMGWDELRELSGHEFVTIAGHTQGHFALAKLPMDAARRELDGGARRIEQELGKPCRHVSFPYGDAGSAREREFRIAANLGFQTAVTTRKGVVTATNARHLTALPRVSINGNFQSMACFKALLSGLPFALTDVARLRNADARASRPIAADAA